jgi:hypothetical protein
VDVIVVNNQILNAFLVAVDVDEGRSEDAGGAVRILADS